MIGLNPTRLGLDMGQTVLKHSHKFDVLNIKQMEGIFLFYRIFHIQSLLIFTMELIWFINKIKWNKMKKKKHIRKIHVISWNKDKRESYWMIQL